MKKGDGARHGQGSARSPWAADLSHIVVNCSAVLAMASPGQNNSSDEQAVVLQLLMSLPSCILPCSATYPPDCPPTRLDCFCRPFSGATLDCVFQSCKGWDVILAKRATSVACGEPFPEDGRVLHVISWVCTGIATAAVLLRMAGRLVTAGRAGGRLGTNRGWAGLWWDDAMLLVSYLLLVIIMALSEVGVRHGFGDGPWVKAPEDLNLQGTLVFSGEPIYFLAAAALKASFLLFFARIFAVGSSVHQSWGLPFGGLRDRWTLAGVLRWAHIANVVVAFTFIVVVLAQCQPMSYFWKGWDGIQEGTCINRKAVPLVHAVLGIVLDVWILMIPLCMLPSLRISFWTKMGIASMFCVGTLATIVSGFRIPPVARDIDSSYSLTWNQTEVLKWTQLEMTAGIVCACMPGHGALFSRLFRRARTLLGLGSTTANRTTGHSRSKSGGLGGTSGGTGSASVYLSSMPTRTELASKPEGGGLQPEPWGSTVELRSLGTGSDTGDEAARRHGHAGVETRVWADSGGEPGLHADKV